MRALTLPALLIGLALTGCGQQEEGASDPSSEPVSEVDTASPGSAALWAGGEKRPLDIQTAHPNGVVLQLTSLQSRPTETVVGVRVINGRDRAVDLHRFNSNRDGYLALDTGERLYLSPPDNNARLSIEAGQTMEGELVFLGKLPPSPSAVLILNANRQTDSQHTTTPGFRINLPLGELAVGTAQ